MAVKMSAVTTPHSTKRPSILHCTKHVTLAKKKKSIMGGDTQDSHYGLSLKCAHTHAHTHTYTHMHIHTHTHTHTHTHAHTHAHTYTHTHTHARMYTHTHTHTRTHTFINTNSVKCISFCRLVYLSQVSHEGFTDIFLVLFIEQLQLPQLLFTIAKIKGLSSSKAVSKRDHNLRV